LAYPLNLPMFYDVRLMFDAFLVVGSTILRNCMMQVSSPCCSDLRCMLGTFRMSFETSDENSFKGISFTVQELTVLRQREIRKSPGTLGANTYRCYDVEVDA
jgi:hypothetical protein